MASAQTAQAVIAEFARAAKTCSTVQIEGSPGSTSKGRLSVVPAPKVGDRAAAFYVTVTSGPMAGVSMTIVGVATGRIIVGMTFAMANTTVVSTTTKLAVRKAQKTLGGQAAS